MRNMLFLCPPNKCNRLYGPVITGIIWWHFSVLNFVLFPLFCDFFNFPYSVYSTLWSCLMCTFFFFSLISGQNQCKPCPPDTYAMRGASKCLPLPNCTTDDIIDAPGDLNTCSCTPPQSATQCNTTVRPYFVTVQGELRSFPSIELRIPTAHNFMPD